MTWNEYVDPDDHDPRKTRESEWGKKINDNYKPLVDAVRNLEVCIGYREYVRHGGDPDEPTMTVQRADRDVRLARGKLWVALYAELTGEQTSK
jgi:hypothetical protein